MESHLKSLIIERLRATIAEESQNLVISNKSYEEYRQAVGHIRGLLLAIDIIQETYTDYMKN